MIPKKHSMIVLLLLFSLFAVRAWAVVGTGEVVVADEEGKPLPGVTITLTPKGQPPITKETDSQGTATFELEEGTYEVEIMFDNIRTWAELSVPGMVQITFPRSGAFPPIMTGTRAEFAPEVVVLEDVKLIEFRERVDRRLVDAAGNVLFSSSTTNVADSQALAQRNAEIAHDLNFTAWTAEGNVGLGSYGDFNHKTESTENAKEESITFPDKRSRHPRKRFYPSLTVLVGRANVEFNLNALRLFSPFSSSTYEGNGTIVGAGLNGLVYLCEDCGWFGSGTYRYEQVLETDMDAVPQFPIGAGGVIVRGDFGFEYKGNMAQVIVGRDFEHIAPYVGVRGQWRDISLTGDVEGNFANVLPGLNGVIVLVFTQEFDENDIEPVFGMGFRHGHVVAGVETSFSKRDSRIKFRIGFGL